MKANIDAMKAITNVIIFARYLIADFSALKFQGTLRPRGTTAGTNTCATKNAKIVTALEFACSICLWHMIVTNAEKSAVFISVISVKGNASFQTISMRRVLLMARKTTYSSLLPKVSLTQLPSTYVKRSTSARANAQLMESAKLDMTWKRDYGRVPLHLMASLINTSFPRIKERTAR